jgi:hypothetical protein
MAKKTLDIQHNMRLNDFQERQSRLELFKNDLSVIESKLYEMDELRRKEQEFTENMLNEYLQLQDSKHALEKNILNLERSCDEVDYYVHTASLLFKYYDIVEKGVEDLGNNTKVMKDKSVLKYFLTSNAIEPEQKNARMSDRATILDKYLSYTDPNYLKGIETECNDQCLNCCSTNRSILLNDGLIFCNDCDTVEYIIVDHERPSYRDPPKEISYFNAEYNSRLKVYYLLVARYFEFSASFL